MASETKAADAFDRALAEIPSCALTEEGVQEQRARYARLASSVARVHSDAEVLEIEFSDAHDQELLDETLAVERECCPVFLFEQTGQILRVTVRNPEQAPALDAFAQSLSAAQEAR
jgi:hypothetical protein